MSKIIRRALKILESRMTYETDFFNSPRDTKNYLRLKLGGNINNYTLFHILLSVFICQCIQKTSDITHLLITEFFIQL